MTALSTVFKFMAEYYKMGTGFGPRAEKVGLERWSLNRTLYSLISIWWFPVMFIFQWTSCVQIWNWYVGHQGNHEHGLGDINSVYFHFKNDVLRCLRHLLKCCLCTSLAFITKWQRLLIWAGRVPLKAFPQWYVWFYEKPVRSFSAFLAT